jgi:hypothetical protein
MRTTWRAIVLLTFLSLIAIGTSFTALRVVAQERPPEPASSPEPSDTSEAPREDTATAPTEGATPPAAPQAGAPGDADALPEGEGVVSDSTLEIPPDLRMSADDTVSFPVDI